MYPEKNENINSKRYMHPNVCSNVIYNSQDMEATQVPINRQMNEYVVCVCVYIMVHILYTWNSKP